jgi:hypothetical protein
MLNSLHALDKMIVRVFVEQAAVETEELPTIIFEVVGISCRRFSFYFKMGFDTL